MKCPHCKKRIPFFSRTRWGSEKNRQCPFCLNPISLVFSFKRIIVGFCFALVVIALSQLFRADHPTAHQIAVLFASCLTLIFGQEFE